MTVDSVPDKGLEPNCGMPATSNGSGALDVARLVSHLLASGKKDIYHEVEIEVDRAVLQTVLNHTRGNQVQASELLGISRTTLRTKLRSLSMAVEKQVLLRFGETR
jgi:DNA-binding protein Fis